MPFQTIVNPGDLITANLLMRLFQFVNGLEARLDERDAATIPSVLGFSLSQAVAELSQRGFPVSLVLDVEGNDLSNLDQKVGNRVVVSHLPSPGDRVSANRQVALLVSAEIRLVEEGPRILRVTQPAAVGKAMNIEGANFDDKIVVTFDQQPVSGFKVSSDTLIRFDAVPPFKTSPAPGAERQVLIGVQGEKGRDSRTVRFINEVVSARPIITSVSIRDKRTMVINGGGFSDVTTENEVFFGATEKGTVKTATRSRLTTSLPKQLEGFFDQLTDHSFDWLRDATEADIFRFEDLDPKNPLIDARLGTVLLDFGENTPTKKGGIGETDIGVPIDDRAIAALDAGDLSSVLREGVAIPIDRGLIGRTIGTRLGLGLEKVIIDKERNDQRFVVDLSAVGGKKISVNIDQLQAVVEIVVRVGKLSSNVYQLPYGRVTPNA